MAAYADNKELKKLLCRFYSNGICRYMNNCPFSHNSDTSFVIPENVCIFFLLNQCRYGHNCQFAHQDINSILASINFNSNDQFKLNSSSSSETTSFPSSSSLSKCLSNSSQYFNTNRDSSSTSLTQNEVQHSLAKHSRSWSTSLSHHTGTKTYAQACKEDRKEDQEELMQELKKRLPLCPYALVADSCPQIETCTYLHGDRCEYCDCMCLHPHDEQQRKDHREECIKEHEREMEQAFAFQRSLDKACGICMDLIMEKEAPGERRFGILEKCDHIFCLSCIRKWRSTKQFDKKTIRSCPECRVFSSFVIPSKYWYDNSEDKDRLIAEYKKVLSEKPCKHFKQGQGECPFAGACFYLHAYPDGRKAEMPPPQIRRRENQDGESDNFRVSSNCCYVQCVTCILNSHHLLFLFYLAFSSHRTCYCGTYWMIAGGFFR